MSVAGRFNNIYLNTGTYPIPVWSRLIRIADVKIPKGRPTSRRAYRGVNSAKTVTGYLDFSITCRLENKAAHLTHAQAATLEDSLLNETVLDIIAVNAPLIVPTGNVLIGKNAVGLRGHFVVTKFDRDEPEEDGTSTDLQFNEVYYEVSDVLKEVISFTQVIAAAS